MDGELFKMKYEGVALDTHEIDVNDLAPALMAMGHLLDSGYRVVNGGTASVKLNVKAFPSGSFGIDFSVVESGMSNLVSMFTTTQASGILNLFTALGLVKSSVHGLLWLIKKIGKDKIKSVTVIEDGKVRVEIENQTNFIIVEKKVLDLYTNTTVRKSLETIITKPLTKEGVDRISFWRGNEEQESVSKEESEDFTSPEIEETLISEREYETSLQIVAAVFQQGNKWKFSNGSASFFANVEDRGFVDRVSENVEAFRKDDILTCLVDEKQYRTLDGITTKYTIKKVIEHKPPIQIQLPFN